MSKWPYPSCQGGLVLMVSHQSRRHPLSYGRETSCPWKEGFFQLQAPWPYQYRNVCSHPQDSWPEKKYATGSKPKFAVSSFDTSFAVSGVGSDTFEHTF